MVFANDVSVAIPSEGGLGGEAESLDRGIVEVDSDVPSRELSVSAGCDACCSNGGLSCEFSSISAASCGFSKTALYATSRRGVQACWKGGDFAGWTERR